MGASYAVSQLSTSRVQQGLEATAAIFNASSSDEIIFGSSSTQVAENLARSLEPNIRKEHEIIVCFEHETNVGPWVNLAKRVGCKVLFWKPSLIKGAKEGNPYAVELQLDDLLEILSPNTRVVAMSACSNILGLLLDVERTVKSIRARQTENQRVDIVVDCVAYAPHRRLDVQAWGVDYAFFSYYKVGSLFLVLVSVN